MLILHLPLCTDEVMRRLLPPKGDPFRVMHTAWVQPEIEVNYVHSSMALFDSQMMLLSFPVLSAMIRVEMAAFLARRVGRMSDDR